jgi:hypothetical protein
VSGYEIKKKLRHRHVKRSYVSKILAARRRKLYNEAIALLLTTQDVIAPALPAVDIKQRFLEQAEKWSRETRHLSSPAQQMMHPSYQAILGMGNENPRAIISLMIRDMQTSRRPWFWALSYFAQENPVSQSDAGKTDKMIKAWVDWEKARQSS